jgi:hypothetical protein
MQSVRPPQARAAGEGRPHAKAARFAITSGGESPTERETEEALIEAFRRDGSAREWRESRCSAFTPRRGSDAIEHGLQPLRIAVLESR